MNSYLVLATKQFSQLDQLLAKTLETMEFELIERQEGAPLPEGWIEFLPYATLSAYDPNNGDMKFAARQTLTDNAEAPEVVKTAVGFASPINNVDFLTCQRFEKREDGTTVYHLSSTDVLTTALAATRENLQSIIGFDPIEHFGIDVGNTIRFTFFNNHTQEGSTDTDRVGISIPVTLSPENLLKVYQGDPDVQPRADLKEFVVNAGQMLMSFDVSEVASKTINAMASDHKIEPWSVIVISQQLLQYFEMMRAHLSYADIIQAVKKNVDTMRANAQAQEEALRTAAEQAQQAISKAEEADAANAINPDDDNRVAECVADSTAPGIQNLSEAVCEVREDTAQADTKAD